MIFLTFKSTTGLKLGIKSDHGVIDVAQAAAALAIPDVPAAVEVFYRAGRSALPVMQTLVDQAMQADDRPWLLDESACEFGPCVPNPGKILCVGLNYQRHAAESGMEPPTTPVLFSKFNNSIAAPDEPVPLPSNAVEYDYEAELVIVIGRQARYVSVDDALDYVLGYCNANDISARDLQMLTSQWLLGKSLDKFLPIGPYMVTADEAGDPQAMQVRCWLNGEVRQDSNTADMIFSVAEIVSYASQYMTLEPGDIISTGTPEGVILGMPEKVWMKPGDETVIEVGKLGKLTNKMIGEG